MRRLLPAVLGCVLTAGACSAPGTTAPPGLRTPSKASAQVAFTMRWPAKSSSQAGRRPAFISPSAKSVIVEVNPGASTPGPVTFANAPAGGGSSTITIDAPPGNDVFDISLYDQPQISGETTAAGNELGSVTTAKIITADVLNALSATVIGTVASVTIGPLPNQSNVLAVAGSSPPVFELVGRTPATFAVAPLDVDGNVIVQPDAPPAIALAPNVRAVGILSVTPVAGTPGEFTVAAVAPNTTTYPTSLVATAADANGDSATSTQIVDVTSAVYVAYANGGTPAVARFDPRGTILPLAASAFAGLSDPVGLAYDADDRAIFVADAGLGKVLAFGEDGTPLATFTAPAVAGVNGIVYDPNSRNVYASGSAGVTVFSPSGGAPQNGIPASFSSPNAQGITYDDATPTKSLERIAVGNAATSDLAFFTESGSGRGSAALTSAPIAVAYGAPLTISQSPETTAQLYVTGTGAVQALDPTGIPVHTTSDAGGPYGVAVDPNTRAVQVAERSGNAVTTYLDDLSAVDATRSFSTPTVLGLTQPQGVCDVF